MRSSPPSPIECMFLLTIPTNAEKIVIWLESMFGPKKTVPLLHMSWPTHWWHPAVVNTKLPLTSTSYRICTAFKRHLELWETMPPHSQEQRKAMQSYWQRSLGRNPASSMFSTCFEHRATDWHGGRIWTERYNAIIHPFPIPQGWLLAPRQAHFPQYMVRVRGYSVQSSTIATGVCGLCNRGNSMAMPALVWLR